MNGVGVGVSQASATLANLVQTVQPSPGFVAVNSRPAENGASSSTRHDLMSKFHTLNDRRSTSQPSNGTLDARRPSIGQHGASHPATPVTGATKPSKPSDLRPPHISESELHHIMNSPVPIPNTPSSLLPAASQRAQQPQDKDDGGPFKAEMVYRMESLLKGERIMPPCDRCRRLHMDCLKNLTACMGCTKKHAKCSWKEVRENELRAASWLPPPTGMTNSIQSESEENESATNAQAERASTGSPAAVLSPQRQGGQQEARISSSSNRTSPPRPDRERERDRHTGVEAQLQEAAKSGLAHANARLGAPDGGKAPEYQALVA